MSSFIKLIMLSLVGAICGCASLTTFTGTLPVAEKSVALDMKTRVVFEKSGVVCAEPSPDALSAIGASGGLSAKGGNASFGLSESAAFTGLRTQSIQLLRDAMYRLCEGLASGKLSDNDFRSLQRRYQTTMLALLAIEQLTQPVVAGQVLLTSQAAASAGAGAGDPAVTKAEQAVETAAGKRLDLETELETAQRQREETATELRAKKATRGAAKDATLETEIATLEKQLAERDGTLADKRRRLEQARSDELKARQSLSAALNRTASSAAAGGVLGSPAMAFAQSTESVAKAVGEIVDEAYDTFADEACLDFMKFLIDPDRTGGSKGASPATGGSRLSSMSASTETQALESATTVMRTCAARFERRASNNKSSKTTTTAAPAAGASAPAN